MKRFTSSRNFFMVAALATGSFFVTSCEDKTDAPAGAYSYNAVLISNEGSFSTSNASVSYYNRSDGAVQNAIFSKENSPQVLGDVLQSITIYNDRAYMVMNNSQKIAVANANTFKAEGEISNLAMPRYFTALNNQKGYATEWVSYDGNGRVAVIDLETLAVTKTIEVGVNPEQLVFAGGKLYVGHAGSDFVTVINTATDAVESHIPLTFGPKYLVIDQSNSLWALSTGQKHWSLDPSEHTAGALSKINLSSNTVSSTLTFGSNTASTGKLAINGNSDKLIYGYNGSIYQHDVNATALNATALINRSFYGLGVDPATGQIYAGVAPSFTTDGWVVRFNATGAAIDSFRVGVAPNDFAFR